MKTSLPPSNSYSRHQFLRQLGFGGAALMAVSCAGLLTACENSSVTPQPDKGVDFTLDLSASANAKLKTNGGYIISNGIVVARTMSSSYAAVTVVCSHEGRSEVTFRTSNEFYCTAHGARYNTSGNGLNSDGRNGLTSYKTELVNATTLRIYA